VNWDAIAASAQNALVRTLSSQRVITYTSAEGHGQVDLTGRALFRERAPRLITLETGEPSVQGEYPTLGVRVADLPGGVCNQRDIVVVDGKSYEVMHKAEDGEGTPDLELREL
jgi:hypothetical protein